MADFDRLGETARVPADEPDRNTIQHGEEAAAVGDLRVFKEERVELPPTPAVRLFPAEIEGVGIPQQRGERAARKQRDLLKTPFHKSLLPS